MADIFDYIVIGAGSAGCVLAERLSADGRSRVLLLEEGPEDRSWLIRMPRGVGKLMMDPAQAHYYPTAAQRSFGPELWVRGKVVGGSSSTNGLVWIRCQPEDFDNFEARGASGWGWSSIAPFFKRLEDHA